MTPFWCAASPGLQAGEDVNDERLARAQAVTAAIRAHYLRLPDKTVEGWADVLADPRRYNYVWRHMLKHACGQDLDLQPFPPPSHLQHLLPGERA